MWEVDLHYVYILEGVKVPGRFYVGYATDIKAQFKAHNKGDFPHTAAFRPWRLKTYLAFSEEQAARDFESFLKTPSGRAFAKQRL